jgi:hypothetical protein
MMNEMSNEVLIPFSNPIFSISKPPREIVKIAGILLIIERMENAEATLFFEIDSLIKAEIVGDWIPTVIQNIAIAGTNPIKSVARYKIKSEIFPRKEPRIITFFLPILSAKCPPKMPEIPSHILSNEKINPTISVEAPKSS